MLIQETSNMFDEGSVHQDCRNASNPYHECSDYCFRIIAEAMKKTRKAETECPSRLVSDPILKVKSMDHGFSAKIMRGKNITSDIPCIDDCLSLLRKREENRSSKPNDSPSQKSVVKVGGTVGAKAPVPVASSPLGNPVVGRMLGKNKPSLMASELAFNSFNQMISILAFESRLANLEEENRLLAADMRRLKAVEQEANDQAKVLEKVERRLQACEEFWAKWQEGHLKLVQEHNELKTRLDESQKQLKHASSEVARLTSMVDSLEEVNRQLADRVVTVAADALVKTRKMLIQETSNMSEEGIGHQDCRNASNPYHECSDYCLRIIAEAKKKMRKAEAECPSRLVSDPILKVKSMDHGFSTKTMRGKNITSDIPCIDDYTSVLRKREENRSSKPNDSPSQKSVVKVGGTVGAKAPVPVASSPLGNPVVGRMLGKNKPSLMASELAFNSFNQMISILAFESRLANLEEENRLLAADVRRLKAAEQTAKDRAKVLEKVERRLQAREDFWAKWQEGHLKRVQEHNELKTRSDEAQKQLKHAPSEVARLTSIVDSLEEVNRQLADRVVTVAADAVVKTRYDLMLRYIEGNITQEEAQMAVDEYIQDFGDASLVPNVIVTGSSSSEDPQPSKKLFL